MALFFIGFSIQAMELRLDVLSRRDSKDNITKAFSQFGLSPRPSTRSETPTSSPGRTQLANLASMGSFSGRMSRQSSFETMTVWVFALYAKPDELKTKTEGQPQELEQYKKSLTLALKLLQTAEDQKKEALKKLQYARSMPHDPNSYLSEAKVTLTSALQACFTSKTCFTNARGHFPSPMIQPELEKVESLKKDIEDLLKKAEGT